LTYFDTREREALIKSKALEAQLRTAANEILMHIRPTPKQEALF